MDLESRHRALGVFVLLVLTAGAITFLRDPDNYLLPRLPYEDGRDIFGFFYNHREPSSVLRFYNGYVALGPNLVGYLAFLLPTSWVPYLLALVPLVVSSITFAGLSLPEYRRWIQNDTLRIVAAVSLASFPVANYHFISTTAYSIWILLFLLILLSIAPAPSTARRAVARALVMTLLICSTPLSLVLVPIYLVLLLRQPRQPRWKRGYYATLAIAVGAYQWFGVQAEAAAAPPPGQSAELTVLFTLERVVFGTLLGDHASRQFRRIASQEAVFLVGGIVFLSLLVLVFAYRKRLDTVRWTQLATLVYLIVTLTYFYVVSRAPTLGILAGNKAFRYFWIQRLCLILLIFVVIDVLWGAGLRHARPALIAALLSAYGGYLVYLNAYNNQRYLTRPHQGHQLAAFVAEVSRQESTGNGAVQARLDRGRWSIEVQRPPRRTP